MKTKRITTTAKPVSVALLKAHTGLNLTKSLDKLLKDFNNHELTFDTVLFKPIFRDGDLRQTISVHLNCEEYEKAKAALEAILGKMKHIDFINFLIDNYLTYNL